MRQKRNNYSVEQLVPHLDKAVAHLAVSADNPGDRHPLRNTKTVSGDRLCQRGGIGNAAGRPACLFQVAIKVDADADDLQALRLVFFVEGIEFRHFLAARRAPRRPVVDHHHLASQRGEIESRAVKRGEN